jgi:hypothetical protein
MNVLVVWKYAALPQKHLPWPDLSSTKLLAKIHALADLDLATVKEILSKGTNAEHRYKGVSHDGRGFAAARCFESFISLVLCSSSAILRP